ncbi:MAG: MCE family protein [Chloroflexaceae bacterium]|nr:MCE family protein [Chloroflexaceae bacterium]
MLKARTVREGSVGLLALAGLLIFGGSILWLRNLKFGQEGYSFVVTFPDVNGIQEGGPVNFRGFRVGQISRIQPGVNGVDVTLDINAGLLIPRAVQIQANSSGLIGETSVDITPLETVPPEIKRQANFTPSSGDCNPQQFICAQEKLQGAAGPQLIPTLARLSELYGNEEFFNNVNGAAKNTAIAAQQITDLSEDISSLAGSVEGEIKSFSAAANSVSATAQEATQLVDNVNQIVGENRNSLNETLGSVNRTSNQLNDLIANTNLLVRDTNGEVNQLLSSLRGTLGEVNAKLDSVDTQRLTQNLEALTTDAAQASANLRRLSETLNEPANLTVLQQTLDSARATFENAEKITADLDELTGDPAFRRNLRDLVNGLSNLVSSTEQLEQQIVTAQQLQLTVKTLQKHIESLEAAKASSQAATSLEKR